MIDRNAKSAEPVRQSEDRLMHVSRAAFAAAWEALVGEPPAAMLENRSEMIRILVDSTPIARSTGSARPDRARRGG